MAEGDEVVVPGPGPAPEKGEGDSMSEHGPDAYDRQLAALHGLPDTVRTKTATTRTIPPLGIGGTELWILQTYRQREQGDFLFLEVVGQAGTVRLVIPPAVTAVINRQRDAVTGMVRSKAARASAADRKARGWRPDFTPKPSDGAGPSRRARKGKV